MLKPVQLPNVPVLLADESAFVRRTVRAMLIQSGIRQVVESADGGDLLIKLGQFRPELIVMDWDLPVLDGPDLVDMIRGPDTGAFGRTPIVLMTARPTPRLMEQAAARGILMVLRKPFSPKVLWQRLAAVFEPHSPVGPTGGALAV